MLKENVYFPNLDGLRFIAASMVLMPHAFVKLAEHTNITTDWICRIGRTLASGGMGVSIFFVLSGFLITYLLLEEKRVSGAIQLKKFYMRRVLRIWPLYFFVVAFGIVIYPWLKSLLGIETDLCSRPIYYWTFLSNFDEINIHKTCLGQSALMLGITWSVSIEEQFYIFWPLFFVLLKPKYYPYIFITIILFSLGFRIYNFDDDPVLYFHTFSVLIDIAIGGLAAWLAINTKVIQRIFSGMTLKTSLIIYVVGFIGLMYWDIFEKYAYCHALLRIYFATYFVFIILHQNYAPDSFLKLSHNRFFSSMGKYTYGIYLLHPLAILITDVALRTFHVERPTFASELFFVIPVILLTFIISIGSYHLYEKRFLKLKERFTVIRSH